MDFQSGQANGLLGINPPREKPWHLTSHHERSYARGWKVGEAERERNKYLESLSSSEWIEPN